MINWARFSLTGRYAHKHRKPSWMEVAKCGALMFIDVSVVFTITFVLYTVVIWRSVSPSQLGFYCNDTSIQKPFVANTVPTKLLLLVTLAGPLAVFGISAMLVHKKFFDPLSLVHTIRFAAFSYLDYILSFWVATAILDYLKCHVSRLRPNFIEMCKPDTFKLCQTNSTAYINSYVCTAHWKDARISQTSFPSGHSGASAFALVFVVYFFQQGMFFNPKNYWLSKFRLLCLSFYSLFAVFCFVTRVTDGWHHISDVVGGIVIGVVVFFLTYRGKFRHSLHID